FRAVSGVRGRLARRSLDSGSRPRRLLRLPAAGSLGRQYRRPASLLRSLCGHRYQEPLWKPLSRMLSLLHLLRPCREAWKLPRREASGLKARATVTQAKKLQLRAVWLRALALRILLLLQVHPKRRGRKRRRR